jgi:type I restriction enzyme S subunit
MTNMQTVPLSEIIDALEAGVSVNSEDRTANGRELGVLKTSCVKDGWFYPKENKAILASEVSRLKISNIRMGSILISRMNTLDLVGSVGYVDDDYPYLYLPDRLWKVLIKDAARDDSRWLCQVLNSPHVRTQLKARATGTSGSMKNISQEAFLGIRVYRPPLVEQRAIADLLTEWDLGLRQLSGLITAKRHFKSGLFNQLLTGSRQFEGVRGSSLVPTTIGEVFSKLNRPVKVVSNQQYSEIGIRSHGKGIFHKEPVLGTILGDKRVFRVEPGCLTLNVVFAWERALGVTTESEQGMIASHRFPMFRPDSGRVSAEYVLQYLLSPNGHKALQLASPGGAGRNRTLNQTEFLRIVVPLPPIQVQNKCVELLYLQDTEILILERLLECLKQQKTGLMHRILTDSVHFTL